MNTSEISVPSSPSIVDTGADVPYLEGGFAGVVVTIALILLKAVLSDWLHDQQVMRELIKKLTSKE